MSNEELRIKYVKVSSQEEANKIYDYLESIGETVDRNWNNYSDVCTYICYILSLNWILTSISATENLTEVTLSEFLEEIDYQNVLDIEVGDTVRCISENKSEFNNYAGFGWEADLEFVVSRVDKHNKYNVYFGGKRGQGVYSDAVRLVKKKEVLTEKKEILYYKVALVDEAAAVLRCKKGDIFSCENTNFSSCIKLKDNTSGWICEGNDFSKIFNTLQKAEEFAKTLLKSKPEVDEHNGFKVGKKYKYRQSNTLAYYVGLSRANSSPIFELIDTSGITLDKDELSADYIPKGNNTYWRYSMLHKEFDLIPIESEVYKPKVGDWVFTDMFNFGKYSKDIPVLIIHVEDSHGHHFKVKTNDGTNIWCYPNLSNTSFLRKALPHEIPNDEVEYSITPKEPDIKGLSDVLERDFDSTTKANIVDKFTESLGEDDDNEYYKVDTSMY